MRIYMASYFNTRARLLPWRDQIVRRGHYVCSTWLDEARAGEEVSYDSNKLSLRQQMEVAMRDLDELDTADVIILDTFDKNPRGGREVEWGYMLNDNRDVHMWLVGPPRNVFHHLADRQFKHWGEVLDALSYNK